MSDGIKNLIVIPQDDVEIVPGQGATRVQFFTQGGEPFDLTQGDKGDPGAPGEDGAPGYPAVTALADGTYQLQVTVVDGEGTPAWVLVE